MSSKFIAQCLRSLSAKAGSQADRLEHLVPSEVASRVLTQHELWLAAKGDKVLRMEYPLSSRDVVLDVGGYEGQWASDIYSRYLCTVHVFEPIPQFAEAIRHRFRLNSNILIHQCGLGEADGELRFSIEGDASSSVVVGGQSVAARVVAFDSWCQNNQIVEIGLIKVNIEGGEYALVEHLIESGWIHKVRNLQVQFHDFFPEAKARMDSIRERLAHSHQSTYQFEFIWENWKLKD